MGLVVSALQRVLDAHRERDLECREVRPHTLGYQLCWKPKGHTDLHKSQDGTQWASPPINPDCAQGKHHACRGDAWDQRLDRATDCVCDCHPPSGCTCGVAFGVAEGPCVCEVAA